MANIKNSRGIEVFAASALGKMAEKGIRQSELSEANAYMQSLAKDPNPTNRYELAQIAAFTVNEILIDAEDWLEKVADVKSVSLGDKPQFKVDLSYIKAYIQAKGSTTPRSRCVSRYVTIETEEISARPHINLYEMRTGKYDFSDWLKKAAIEMTNKKLERINSVLKAAASSSGALAGAYAAGNGIVKSTFDAMLRNFSRLGQVNLVGDIEVVGKFNGISGFNGVSAPSDKTQDEILNNGYIGKYLGANVSKITNPCKPGTLTPIIDTKMLYLLAGLESPLKVINEGDIYSMDATCIDDDTYEICLRQYFGTGVVLGTIPTIGAYEDTSI